MKFMMKAMMKAMPICLAIAVCPAVAMEQYPAPQQSAAYAVTPSPSPGASARQWVPGSYGGTVVIGPYSWPMRVTIFGSAPDGKPIVALQAWGHGNADDYITAGLTNPPKKIPLKELYRTSDGFFQVDRTVNSETPPPSDSPRTTNTP